MSGAGAGKGLLARCMCIIAFGRDPHAVTAGATAEELEKRIAAELMGGSPALFLDNLNNTAFRSDLLASAITERPARVRLLGKSQMVPLNASAFVIMTGNGLSVSEDLARRFVAVEFDPRTEDPEARPFKNDIRAEVRARRTELLAALLTIWRWGRLATDIKPGLPLGSFEQWCRWVRDPLLALGCQDPVERVSEAKARDGAAAGGRHLRYLVGEAQRPARHRPQTSTTTSTCVLDPQGRGGASSLAAQPGKACRHTRSRFHAHPATRHPGNAARCDLRPQASAIGNSSGSPLCPLCRWGSAKTKQYHSPMRPRPPDAATHLINQRQANAQHGPYDAYAL